MNARRHKTYVVATDATWREWKALCARRGDTIEGKLGRLVEREVARSKRKPVPKTT